MLPYNSEHIVRERQETFRQQAERMRLINSIERKNRNAPNLSLKIANWFGIQMERWGRQLQHSSVKAPSQVTTAGIADVIYPH